MNLPPILYWSPSLAQAVAASDPGTVLAGVIDFSSQICWFLDEDGPRILRDGLPADALRLVLDTHPPAATP